MKGPAQTIGGLGCLHPIAGPPIFQPEGEHNEKAITVSFFVFYSFGEKDEASGIAAPV